MSEVIEVETAQGRGRLSLDAPAKPPRALLMLGHGAGGGIEARDLAVIAAELPRSGVLVARFEQPYRVAGRKVGPRGPALDVPWLAGVAELRRRWPDLPLTVGGRSAGARVACRTAEASGADAVLCLAFPLHPPGSPEKSRAAELLGHQVPTVVLQGRNDPFGGAAEVEAEIVDRSEQYVLLEMPHAGHDLRPAKQAHITPEEWRTRIVIAADQAVSSAIRRSANS